MMKAVPCSVATACALLLSGCSVEINATNGIARAASSMEIQDDTQAAAARPDGAGTWVLLTAMINREDVERIVRREVYSHVYIVECATGREMGVGTEPRLEAANFANFDDVKALLKEHSAKQAYQMRSSVFAREGDFRTPQCLQFRGGSYLGQRITERRILIRTSGQLP